MAVPLCFSNNADFKQKYSTPQQEKYKQIKLMKKTLTVLLAAASLLFLPSCASYSPGPSPEPAPYPEPFPYPNPYPNPFPFPQPIPFPRPMPRPHEHFKFEGHESHERNEQHSHGKTRTHFETPSHSGSFGSGHPESGHAHR